VGYLITLLSLASQYLLGPFFAMQWNAFLVCFCTRCCTEFRTKFQKDYSFVRPTLPDKSLVLAFTTEVLRLAEGADITQGGWVGGDSWFGSVTRAVEVGI
jgi:hypothetical protein